MVHKRLIVTLGIQEEERLAVGVMDRLASFEPNLDRDPRLIISALEDVTALDFASWGAMACLEVFGRSSFADSDTLTH